MKTRFTGALSLLVGLAAIVLGVWGFSLTEAMTEASSSKPFDAQHWSLHWRTWSLLIVTLGVALLAAGSALLKRKRWGFILLALVAVLAAFIPWLLRIVGFSRYVFEQPRVTECGVFLTIGIASFFAYQRSGVMHAET